MFSKENENYVYALFAKNLKKYRQAAGLTQMQLAEKSCFALGFIKKIEADNVFQTCSLGTCYKFAQVLNVPLSKLLEDNDEEEQEDKEQ